MRRMQSTLVHLDCRLNRLSNRGGLMKAVVRNDLLGKELVKDLPRVPPNFQDPGVGIRDVV